MKRFLMLKLTPRDKISKLEELGNNLIKLIGTYEVVVWQLLALYIAVRHFLGI